MPFSKIMAFSWSHKSDSRRYFTDKSSSTQPNAKILIRKQKRYIYFDFETMVFIRTSLQSILILLAMRLLGVMIVAAGCPEFAITNMDVEHVFGKSDFIP